MTVNQFHFISGLPRSGSTLLAGIPRQNPRFHAAMSRPVAGLVNALLEQLGASGEFYSFFDDEKRKRMYRTLFDACYEDESEHEAIFDINRMWTARLHQLTELFDDFKVVSCIRNPAWIADAFERIHRKTPFEYSRIYSSQARQTVYSRCEGLMSSVGTVGSAWTALKEAYYGELSDRLCWWTTFCWLNSQREP